MTPSIAKPLRRGHRDQHHAERRRIVGVVAALYLEIDSPAASACQLLEVFP